MRDGFVCDEVAPSPKVQLRAAMLPSASLLPSVKAHVSPVQVCVNAATGGLFDVGGAADGDVYALPCSLPGIVRDAQRDDVGSRA